MATIKSLTVSCTSVTIDADGRQVEVILKDAEQTNIFDEFEAKDLVDHFGEEFFLKAIDSAEARKFYDFPSADEVDDLKSEVSALKQEVESLS